MILFGALFFLVHLLCRLFWSTMALPTTCTKISLVHTLLQPLQLYRHVSSPAFTPPSPCVKHVPISSTSPRCLGHQGAQHTKQSPCPQQGARLTSSKQANLHRQGTLVQGIS
jgi:hypothetical protein